jgi:MerR family transcriptional regulator/heat shock protein HspR
MNAPGNEPVATDPTDARANPCYDVTEAARRAGVHEQTLRHYERLGLVTPARKGARPQSPRLYSEDDIERVTHIRRLMDDLGVNLAGVETILHMRDRMERMQRAMADELLRLRAEHDAETRRLLAIIARLEARQSAGE